MKNIFLSIAMMASVSAFAQQKASIEIYPEKGNPASLPNIWVHVYMEDSGLAKIRTFQT